METYISDKFDESEILFRFAIVEEVITSSVSPVAMSRGGLSAELN